MAQAAEQAATAEAAGDQQVRDAEQLFHDIF
jgi:hypothetical protein